ncbi:MAG: hypothetical protein P4L40_02800 [Terracidiphilus sp.]|nr:hypothetical protein [Terracidiphilus sp.]
MCAQTAKASAKSLSASVAASLPSPPSLPIDIRGTLTSLVATLEDLVHQLTQHKQVLEAKESVTDAVEAASAKGSEVLAAARGACLSMWLCVCVAVCVCVCVVCVCVCVCVCMCSSVCVAVTFYARLSVGVALCVPRSCVLPPPHSPRGECAVRAASGADMGCEPAPPRPHK